MDSVQRLTRDLGERVALVLREQPLGQADTGEVVVEEPVQTTRSDVGKDDLTGGVGGQGRLVQAVEVIQVPDPRRNSGDRHTAILSVDAVTRML